MAVETSNIQPSLSDLRRWILKEVAGCKIDDEKCQIYTYSSYQGCILVLEALAKKILGISGQAIGNNPTRAEGLGCAGERDFTEERKIALKKVTSGDFDQSRYEGELQRLKAEEDFVNRLMKDYDPAAWAKVLELKEILCRLAMSLHRAGLVEFNVDGVVATEYEQRDKELGGTGSSPLEGSVGPTLKGLQAVGAQRWPVPRKRQRSGTHRFDEEVELPR